MVTQNMAVGRSARLTEGGLVLFRCMNMIWGDSD